MILETNSISYLCTNRIQLDFTNQKKKGERKMKNKMLALVATLMLLANALMISIPVVMATTLEVGSGKDYETIQLAVDAAGSGDTILVYAGEYDPFNVIGKDDLTIVANVGDIVVVNGSQSVSTNYANRDAVVFVSDSMNIALEDLDIEGYGLGTVNPKSYGVIYENSSGTIRDCVVSPNTIGNLQSTAIAAWDNSTLMVDPSTIKNFGRIGIFYFSGCSGGVYNSTIIGQVYSGEGDVNYGIEVESYNSLACDIEIIGNDIYNCGNTFTPEPEWSSAGIVIDGWRAFYDLPPSTVAIEENNIHDNYYGIEVVANPCSYAHYNNIYNNTEYGIIQDPDYVGNNETFDARFNWWGDSFGPTASPPAGDKVSGYVDYAPWLIQEYPPAVLVSKLYVDPETKEFWTPSQGTKFSMNVTIANVTDLYGFEFKLTWNSTLIDLVGLQVKVGSIWAHYFIAHNETWHEPDGTDRYWLAASATAPTVTGFTGKATLVKLTFQIKYNPCYPDTCSTPIHFVGVKLSNSTADPIPVWIQDGLYQILSSKPKLEMRLATTVVHKYQDFAIEIWLLNATKVHDYAFEIRYNTTILDTANVIIHDTFLPGPYDIKFLKINETEGSIHVELQEACTAPLANGNGLLVTITFRVAKAEIWKKGQNNTLYSLIKFESWKLSVKCPEPRIQEGNLVSVSNANYWYVPVPGDVNSDGVVNVVDLRMVSMKWDSTDPEILKLVDLNSDGNVDIYDLVLVSKNLTP
jgi:hypothetical protein